MTDGLYSFKEDFKRVPLSASYRFLMLTSASLNLILVVLFLVILAAAGWWTYHEISTEVALFRSGEATKGALILHGALSIASIIVVLALLRPLLRFVGERGITVALEKEKEPVLYEFITDLCERMKAPVPKVIKLDLECNASVRLRGGLLGLINPRSVELSIGLPLLTILPLVHLVGILGHELGHVTQGAALRSSYITRRINEWLISIVVRNDGGSWGARNAGLIGALFDRIAFLLLLGVVWVSRVVSSYLMRQMEYDADRQEVRLVGAGVFEETFMLLHVINIATENTVSHLQTVWMERKAAANVLPLVTRSADDLPHDFAEKITQHLAAEETGLFDTHPSYGDRVANAKAVAGTSVFSSTQPAISLLTDADALGEELTKKFYLSVLGSSYKKANIVAADELCRQQVVEEAFTDAARRFFQDLFDIKFFIESGRMKFGIARHSMPARSRQELENARSEFVQAYPPARELCGQESPTDKFHRTDDKGKKILRRLGRVVGARIMAGVELMDMGKFVESIQDPDLQGAVQTCRKDYIPILRALTKDMYKTKSIISSVSTMWLLTPEGLPKLKELVEAGHISQYNLPNIPHLVESFQSDYKDIQRGFGSLKYPFEHSDGEILVADYLLAHDFDHDEPIQAYFAAQDVLDRYYTLFARCLARVAETIEQVETSFGFEQLPLPS